MQKIVLGGYTGRENRGTEAIAVSTAELFRNVFFESSIAFRTDYEYSENLHSSTFDECLMYRSIHNPLILFLMKVYYRVVRNVNPFQQYCQKELLDAAAGNAVLHIGGDTYCYGVSLENMALTKLCRKKKIPLFLWAASLDEAAVQNRQIHNSLNQYDKIYVREQLTYQTLIENGFDERRLFKMCDPAFTLKPERTELDNEWWGSGKVVGINLSPFATEENPDHMLAIDGCIKIMDYLLNQTQCNVALIPHVFKEDYTLRDYESLLKIQNHYTGNPRIKLLVGDYNCCQLKYIISKCDFMIAARTHASIAAYSSLVPTMVLGYSIKSKGIAMDLFGTYKKYVLPVQELKNSQQLFDNFIELFENKEQIRQILKKKIPEYQELAISATKDLKQCCR